MRKYDFQRVAVEIVFPSDIKVRLKFSAKNCGSMINLKQRSIWVFIIPEYF